LDVIKGSNKMIKEILKKVLPESIIDTARKIKKKRMLSKVLSLYPNTFIHFGELNSKAIEIINEKKYYSQYCQDLYLNCFIFQNKEQGFFLDVGGNHPIYINNTIFFERLGWDGLAFEPSEELVELWKEKRKTPCLQMVLGSVDGEQEFIQYDDNCMSGVSGSVNYCGKIEKKYAVKCRRLQDILNERNIKKIDFMSLDVEGYELEVLLGIDFSKVDINCIVVENNREKKKVKKIRRFLENNGYEIVARLCVDDVFVKND
jgi:FkbM family methyltransferase